MNSGFVSQLRFSTPFTQEKFWKGKKRTERDIPVQCYYWRVLSLLHLTADHRSDGVRRILLHLHCGVGVGV